MSDTTDFEDLLYQLRTIKLTKNQTQDTKQAVALKQWKDLATKRDRNPQLTIVIEDILAKHREEDMTEFLKSRQCLNIVNEWLIYLFYLVQTAGILLTSFAATTNNQDLVWIGVIINSLASLMQIYIKMHDTSLKMMMSDLQLIKEGKYVDQGTVADIDQQADARIPTATADPGVVRKVVIDSSRGDVDDAKGTSFDNGRSELSATDTDRSIIDDGGIAVQSMHCSPSRSFMKSSRARRSPLRS
jgi:hypothetical protein